MEEIIASISRIITDEKTSVEPVRPVPVENSGILELTEVVNEDGSVRRVVPEASSSERRRTGSEAVVDPATANATAADEMSIVGLSWTIFRHASGVRCELR